MTSPDATVAIAPTLNSEVRARHTSPEAPGRRGWRRPSPRTDDFRSTHPEKHADERRRCAPRRFGSAEALRLFGRDRDRDNIHVPVAIHRLHTPDRIGLHQPETLCVERSGRASIGVRNHDVLAGFTLREE